MTLAEINHVITNTKTMLNVLKDAEIITGAEAQDLLTMLVRERVKNECIKD